MDVNKELDQELNDITEEYNVITLVDENGEEAEFEYLGETEYEDVNYIVLLPNFEDEDSEEVVILQITGDETAGENYTAVEDEDLLETVFLKFKEENQDIYEFED